MNAQPMFIQPKFMLELGIVFSFRASARRN
jgi:hypothetical protein